MWFLIMILIIVILYLLLNRCVEGFEGDTTQKDKKALICYYGGSFREGNIGSTKSDTPYGYESQKNASITHEKLKNVLQERGYQTDILINTRETKYSNQLERWYEPFNMIMNEISDKVHAKDKMIQSTIKNINKLKKQQYDFILFVRIDLFLKPDFFEVLDTETDKISFLANNYNPRNCNANDIVDLFVLVPKKYFYILDSKFDLNHWSWNYYKKTYHLKDKDMAFMTNKMFDSNSAIDQNPYYVMASRKENTVLHTDLTSDTKNKVKKCPKYLEHKQTYIDNPSQYYLDKYAEFYLK